MATPTIHQCIDCNRQFQSVDGWNEKDDDALWAEDDRITLDTNLYKVIDSLYYEINKLEKTKPEVYKQLKKFFNGVFNTPLMSKSSVKELKDDKVALDLWTRPFSGTFADFNILTMMHVGTIRFRIIETIFFRHPKFFIPKGHSGVLKTLLDSPVRGGMEPPFTMFPNYALFSTTTSYHHQVFNLYFGDDGLSGGGTYVPLDICQSVFQLENNPFKYWGLLRFEDSVIRFLYQRYFTTLLKNPMIQIDVRQQILFSDSCPLAVYLHSFLYDFSGRSNTIIEFCNYILPHLTGSDATIFTDRSKVVEILKREILLPWPTPVSPAIITNEKNNIKWIRERLFWLRIGSGNGGPVQDERDAEKNELDVELSEREAKLKLLSNAKNVLMTLTPTWKCFFALRNNFDGTTSITTNPKFMGFLEEFHKMISSRGVDEKILTQEELAALDKELQDERTKRKEDEKKEREKEERRKEREENQRKRREEREKEERKEERRKEREEKQRKRQGARK